MKINKKVLMKLRIERACVGFVTGALISLLLPIQVVTYFIIFILCGLYLNQDKWLEEEE